MSPRLKNGVEVSPQRFVASARWALAAAWRANSRLLLGNIAVALARAFIPAAMALTARGLVNATVATVGVHGDLGSVIPWLLLGFALTAAEGVLQLTGGFFAQGLRDDLHYHVTLDVLEHASRLEVARYDDPRFYDLLQRARDQPADHVARFVNEALNIGANVLQIISLLAILIYIEPLVLLVSVGLALPYFRFQWRLSLDEYAVERARTTRRRWSAYFVGLLSGSASVAEVRILGLAPLLIDRFRKLMREFRVQDHILYRRGYRGGSVFVVLITAAIYAAFVRVAYRVLHGSLTVGDLAVFGGATTRLRNAIQVVVQALSNTMERTLYIADVMQFLELPARAVRQGSGAMPGTRGEIELRDVSFAYPDAREPTLDHVSLHIRAGETVALVGENGAGKTTLVKLIAGLYQPDAGQVLFDGTDLRELAPEDLWRRIAFVFQSFGRYEASVSENVAYGDWQRLIDDPAGVREVAALAGVDDLIRSLPNGYDTNIGRQFGEHDLSGGQWQSIAVARAFARNAALLILDEPTSNLDARAEYTLFRRFQELAHGRTTIIVSHRFSTVRVADRILVMENGGIVESGSHDELIAHGGGYARLYDLHMQRLDPQRR